jgi:hypothetical protein
MVEIKPNLSVQIPGGLQFNIAQSLTLEAYKYFDITLDKKNNQLTENIVLSDVQKLNLILIKATFTIANPKDSTSKLVYKIAKFDDKDKEIDVIYTELDTPLLLLGSWVKSLAANKLKIDFKFGTPPTHQDPKDPFKEDFNDPSNLADSVKVEIITGWQEAE